MARQKNLFQFRKYSGRKLTRPVATREFNHLIVKSRLPILRLNHLLIQAVLMKTQRRFGIQLRAFAVMPDHVHLIVKVSSRKQWADALRFFSGQVALRLGRGRIWAERAWSRVVKSGRDYSGAVQYVARNPFKARIADPRIDSLWIADGILFGNLGPPPVTETQEAFAF